MKQREADHVAGATTTTTHRRVGATSIQPGVLGLIDRGLEWLYRRLGWRILVVHQAVGWGAGLGLGLPAGILFLWILGRPGRDMVQFAILILVVWLVATVVATWLSLRALQPLIRWFTRGRPPAGAPQAWVAALRAPRVLVGWNLAIALVLVPVGMCVALAVMGGMPASAYMATALGSVGAVIAGGVAGFLAAQLYVRPMVRDIASDMTERHELPPGAAVRNNLLLYLPMLMLIVGIATPLVSLRPGDGFADYMAVDMPRAIAVVVVFAIPVALLLAFSTLQPQVDLLAGTERIKQGDLTTPVPELSADEHGLLARSFNEARDGLADRYRLADENARLLTAVRESRVRIVAASDAERRRIERNIHDGAQQRLVALILRLRMLQEQDATGPQIRDELAGIMDDLTTAIEELRQLATGLHPAVLTTDGLRPALEQLAAAASVPVTVEAPDRRYSQIVEATAYFVASEALTNVAKYAQAASAQVVVATHDGRLTVTVTDDGIGRARPEAGSGLTGLRDRVEAVGGTFELDSPPGEGTVVHVQLPTDHAPVDVPR